MVVVTTMTCASNKISLFDLSDISTAQKALCFLSGFLSLDQPQMCKNSASEDHHSDFLPHLKEMASTTNIFQATLCSFSSISTVKI